MVLKSKELQALITKYDAEAEKNMRNYQETGISRYERASHKAEDLADTLRVALNGVDEHNKLMYYKHLISMWAGRAVRTPNEGDAKSLLLDIAAVARSEGLIRQDYITEGA